MKVTLISSGKHAVLSGAIPADLYIDCRGIANPFRMAELSGQTGNDETVQLWVAKHNLPYILGAYAQVESAIKTAPTRSGGRGKDNLTVCFFCLAGQHRSPAMKHLVGARLQAAGVDVEVL